MLENDSIAVRDAVKKTCRLYDKQSPASKSCTVNAIHTQWAFLLLFFFSVLIENVFCALEKMASQKKLVMVKSVFVTKYRVNVSRKRSAVERLGAGFSKRFPPRPSERWPCAISARYESCPGPNLTRPERTGGEESFRGGRK